MKKRTKAFTFAELMISLIVISVIGAILYPTIAQFTPNSNKPLFKSAYAAFTSTIMELVNDIPAGELVDDAGSALDEKVLCKRFCDKTNVIHPSGTSDCTTDCTDDIITTSNGMRWRFYEYNTYLNPNPRNGTVTLNNLAQQTFKIHVDVNSSNNRLSQVGQDNRDIFISGCNNARNCGDNCCGVFFFDYSVEDDGIFAVGGVPDYTTSPPTIEIFRTENLKVQDTFEIHIDITGKIISMSPAAWANLEDNIYAPD